MKRLSYNKFLNFVWYQGVWFTAILGREDYELLLAGLLALHIVLCRDWRREVWLMATCAALGATADSILSMAGAYVFDPAPAVLPIPFWLVGLWFGFAGTLRHSMSYLLARPVVAALAGSIAAPLSYFAGARLGAVTFGFDPAAVAVTVGLVWACLMPVFVGLAGWTRLPEINRKQTVSPQRT